MRTRSCRSGPGRRGGVAGAEGGEAAGIAGAALDGRGGGKRGGTLGALGCGGGGAGALGRGRSDLPGGAGGTGGAVAGAGGFGAAPPLPGIDGGLPNERRFGCSCALSVRKASDLILRDEPELPCWLELRNATCKQTSYLRGSCTRTRCACGGNCRGTVSSSSNSSSTPTFGAHNCRRTSIICYRFLEVFSCLNLLQKFAGRHGYDHKSSSIRGQVIRSTTNPNNPAFHRNHDVTYLTTWFTHNFLAYVRTIECLAAI